MRPADWGYTWKMGMRGGHLRVGALGGAVALFTVASCLAPTEVTLVLTTDVPCSTVAANGGTSITVGTDGDVETKSPVTITTNCDSSSGSDNAIGTLVVVPSGGSNDSFAVRIVTGVQSNVSECNAASSYKGCIVARRDLAFVPHTPLTLPIAMRMDCVNVDCTSTQTCVDGICKDDRIASPASCIGEGCGELTLASVDGGGAETLADGMVGAEPGAEEDAASDGRLADGLDSTVVGMSVDATLVDSSAMDAPSVVDAPGHEASSFVDASSTPEDAPADVTSPPGPDASLDASSSIDAGTQDALAPSDAGVLGTCPGVGTSSTGVSCGGGTCAKGQVCCVALPTSGPVTETCTSAGACNIGSTGSPVYSSYACMNEGDCPSATPVCCLTSPVGTSYASTCAASCGPGFGYKTLCRNSCECSSLTCGQLTCGGQPIGGCGGGSSCP